MDCEILNYLVNDLLMMKDYLIQMKTDYYLVNWIQTMKEMMRYWNWGMRKVMDCYWEMRRPRLMVKMMGCLMAMEMKIQSWMDWHLLMLRGNC
jgi:hypothetical protein